jgi:lysophospholipase L1-like esterase
MADKFSYLALGDSYTIGEGVKLADSFPYQTVQMMRKMGTHMQAAEIVAVTGYTSQELAQLMSQTTLLPAYDFVSLLIGVNNQYRGLSLSEFAASFEQLLKRAIALAGHNEFHVAVLSIPDWGKTPFAANRDTEAIAKDIDAYNKTAQTIAQQHKVAFFDITTNYRLHAHEKDWLAEDALHPSGKEYAQWANALGIHWSQLLGNTH